MSEREERRLIRRLAEELATTPRPYPPYARDLLVTEATDYLARPDRVAEVVAAARMHFKLGTLTCNCSVCVAVALLDAAERAAGEVSAPARDPAVPTGSPLLDRVREALMQMCIETHRAPPECLRDLDAWRTKARTWSDEGLYPTSLDTAVSLLRELVGAKP